MAICHFPCVSTGIGHCTSAAKPPLPNANEGATKGWWRNPRLQLWHPVAGRAAHRQLMMYAYPQQHACCGNLTQLPLSHWWIVQPAKSWRAVPCCAVQIAAELAPEAPGVGPADVLATLRFHGIVARPDNKRRRVAAAGGSAAGARRGGAETRCDQRKGHSQACAEGSGSALGFKPFCNQGWA